MRVFWNPQLVFPKIEASLKAMCMISAACKCFIIISIYVLRAAIRSSSLRLVPRDGCSSWKPWGVTVVTWQPPLESLWVLMLLISLKIPSTSTIWRCLITTATALPLALTSIRKLCHITCIIIFISACISDQSKCVFFCNGCCLCALTDECRASDGEDEEGHPERPGAEVNRGLLTLTDDGAQMPTT